ncbi:MAG: DinB family protein [Chloroflexi bacterium]|nr:DinB family protein [Chloroflexota bacterium]
MSTHDPAMPPQVADLLEKLESHRRELLGVLGKMSEEEASRHPNGEWSAKQQIAHLVQAEPAWLDWARTVQDSPGAAVGQTPEEGQIFLEGVAEADAQPLAWWLEHFRQARQETLRRLQSEFNLASEEALARKGTHRTFGEMNVLQCLRAIYRHDRMHIDQVMGREQSFAPRRADGQRQAM